MKLDTHIQIEGDDFKFERDITMREAGEIISYIGAQEERMSKGLSRS